MSTNLFEALLHEHGDSPRTLDWSPEGQRDRFCVLREVGITPESSVLDVGCGLGHFHWNLVAHGWRGAYIGIDQSAALIAARSRVPPAEPATFIVRDAFAEPLPRADFVVSSGMLNLPTPARSLEVGNVILMYDLLVMAFAACRVAAAINMLSQRAVKQRADRHYYDPTLWLRTALAISNRVVLRHDYRDNDFTLYLYRAGSQGEWRHP